MADSGAESNRLCGAQLSGDPNEGCVVQLRGLAKTKHFNGLKAVVIKKQRDSVDVRVISVTRQELTVPRANVVVLPMNEGTAVCAIVALDPIIDTVLRPQAPMTSSVNLPPRIRSIAMGSGKQYCLINMCTTHWVTTT